MTPPRPVTLPGPPPDDREDGRVTVTREPSLVNAGDGRRPTYAVRYETSRTAAFARAACQQKASLAASALVREHRPAAVWLVFGRRAPSAWTLVERSWTLLARAAAAVDAAFVAWVD